MACPHVSGVVALGLSYAAKLHRHFKASEVIDLLYASATPVEQYWNTDEPKYYYKYVVDLGLNHYSSFDLNKYKGKMGSGQVNAKAFLDAIADAGTPMTFPNVLVSAGAQTSLELSLYFDSPAGAVVKVADTSVAEAKVEGGKLVVKGLVQGQSAASITADGKTCDFVITVRNDGPAGGWL